MKFDYCEDYCKWAGETEKRTDISPEKKEKMILDAYAESGGICGMSLLAAEEEENDG